MTRLMRGLRIGAGYGLAVAAVECWMMVARIAQMGLPSSRPPLLALSITVALPAVAGAALSPLLRLRAGALCLLAALAALAVALNDATAPEGSFALPLVIGPPLGGLVLALAGLGLARLHRALPVALGIALLAGAVGFAEARRAAELRARTALGERAPAPAGAPDVVLVVLDTVRARNLSAYGYPRETSPHLDTLAREGALFLDATSPGTWSLPSHASLFTGLLASVHGAHDEHRHLRADVPTLAETLAAAGWDTACFTANPWISDALGTARGFDFRDDAWRSGGAGASFNSIGRLLDALGLGAQDKGGADVVSHFEDWVAARTQEGPPYFAFLNFLEAHFPYHQLPDAYLRKWAEGSRSELRDLSMTLLADQFGSSELDRDTAVRPALDMYDGGVLYADHLLGRVLEALRRRGTLDRTVVVVVSDHGELVGEHGAFGHGRSLFEPATRVPLVVRYPARIAAGTRVGTPVSTLGVMATVLDFTGVALREPVHVGSLAPAIEGGAAGMPVIAERFAQEREGQSGAAEGNPLLRGDLRHRAYRAGPLKLIETSAGERFLFDLATDPDEDRDLAAERPADAARLAEELATWRAALGLPALDAELSAGGATPELDPAARERLRALGYAE